MASKKKKSSAEGGSRSYIGSAIGRCCAKSLRPLCKHCSDAIKLRLEKDGISNRDLCQVLGGFAPSLSGSLKGVASSGDANTDDAANEDEAGLLEFDSSFEGGNLGVSQAVSQWEYELFVRPDLNAPRYRLWFHFQVKSGTPGRRAVLSIVNFSKARSLYREGMTPLVWSTSRPWWERIPPRHVFYYRSVKHCNAYVLSWFYVFEKENETYSFAYSYPFTYTDGQRFLADIERRNLPFLERGLLCRSIQSRKVDYVVIGESGRRPTPEHPRIVAFISARVHPGETPASFVAKGAMDFLCGADPLAKRLRQMITFVIVPMLNPDGCFVGNYRTDTLGVDLNRQWESPSAALEPTLLACKNLIVKYATDPSAILDFYVDVHAHSNARNGFFLCNPPKQREPAAFERAALLPRLMDARLKDFSLSACRFDADPLKSGTGRRVIGDALERTLCYTLEVSMCGGLAGVCAADLGTPGGPQLANETTYMDWGKQLVLSIGDFYLAEKERSIAVAGGSASSSGLGQKRGAQGGGGGGGGQGSSSATGSADTPTVGGVRLSSTVEPPSASGVTGIRMTNGIPRGFSGGRAGMEAADPAPQASPLSFGWRFPSRQQGPAGGVPGPLTGGPGAGLGVAAGSGGQMGTDDPEGSDRPGSSGSDGSLASDAEDGPGVSGAATAQAGGAGAAGGSGGAAGSGTARGGVNNSPGAAQQLHQQQQQQQRGGVPGYMQPIRAKADGGRPGSEGLPEKQWPSTSGQSVQTLPPVQAMTLQPRPSALGPREAARKATGGALGAQTPTGLRAALSAGTLRMSGESGLAVLAWEGAGQGASGDDPRRSGSGGPRPGRHGSLRVLVPSDTGGGSGGGGGGGGGYPSANGGQNGHAYSSLAPPLPSPSGSFNRGTLRSPTGSGAGPMNGSAATGGARKAQQLQQGGGQRSSADGTTVKIVTPTALRNGSFNSGGVGRVTLSPLPQSSYNDRYSGSGEGARDSDAGFEREDGAFREGDASGPGNGGGALLPQQQPPMSPTSVIASTPGALVGGARARNRPAVRNVRRLVSMPAAVGRNGAAAGHSDDSDAAAHSREASHVHTADADLGSNAFILWGRMPGGSLGGGAGRLSATMQATPARKHTGGGGMTAGPAAALGPKTDPIWLLEEAARERNGFHPHPVRSKSNSATIAPASAAFAAVLGPPPQREPLQQAALAADVGPPSAAAGGKGASLNGSLASRTGSGRQGTSGTGVR